MNLSMYKISYPIYNLVTDRVPGSSRKNCLMQLNNVFLHLLPNFWHIWWLIFQNSAHSTLTNHQIFQKFDKKLRKLPINCLRSVAFFKNPKPEFLVPNPHHYLNSNIINTCKTSFGVQNKGFSSFLAYFFDWFLKFSTLHFEKSSNMPKIWQKMKKTPSLSNIEIPVKHRLAF